MTLTIADIVTRRVETVSPEMMMTAAAVIMAEKKISCLVAVSQGKPVGILTEVDLVHAGCQQIDMDSTPVAAFISRPPITIRLNQNIYDAFDFLVEHHIRHVVVVSADGLLEGLISFTDIIKSLSFDDYLKTKRVVDEMSKTVATITPQASVLDAMMLMNRCGISCVVISGGERAQGIFTERDAVRMIAAHIDMANTAVVDVMSTPLHALPLNASLLEASDAMREAGIRRMVIVDELGAAAGILTQFDVIRGLESLRIRHFRHMHERVEERLSESQQLLAEKSELERILNASSAVLYRCAWQADGEHGQFVGTYISPAITSLLGYERQACLQPGWWLDHIHPDDMRKVQANMARLFEREEVDHSYRFASSAGDYRWIQDHSRLHKGVDGKPDELIASWLDITSSRKSEQRVLESEEMYRSLIEQSFDCIMILDADGKIVFANAVCAASFGSTKDEIIGRNLFEIVHPDEQEQMRLRFTQRMSGGGPDSYYESRIVRKNGEIAWVEVSGRLITWHGAPADLITLRDISERKQAAESLLLTQFALDHAPDAVYWMEPDGTFRYVNEAAARMLGYPRETLLGMGVADIDPALPDGIPPEMARASREAGAGRIETTHRTRDGRIIPVEITVGCIAYHGMEYHCSFVRDISGRKAAEETLQASEYRFRSLFNEARDMMHIVGTDGRIIDVNQTELDMLGYSRVEMIGKPVAEITCPEYRDDTLARIRQIMRGEILPLIESALHTREGACIHVELSSTPQYSDTGHVVAGRAILRDITERKQKEKLLARRERQLALLAKAGQSINESLDEAEIGRKLVDLSRKLVVSESGMVGFVREGKVCFSEYVNADESMAIDLSFASGYGVPGHVLLTRSAYISDDAEHDERVIPEIQQALGFCKLIDVPLLDSQGEVLGCFEMHDRLDGACFDAQDLEMMQGLAAIAAAALVNARLLAEQRLNRLEIEQAAERMRRILDADFDAIIVHQDFKVVFSNHQAQQLFGYSSLQETLGVDVMSCYPAEYRHFAARAGRRAMRTGKVLGRMEMSGLSRTKSEPFPIEIASTPIQWAGKPALVTIVRDITQRKAAQEQIFSSLKLAESDRASMRAILNNLPFMAWLKDENSVYLAVNERFAHAFGVDNAETLVGKTDFDICPQDLAIAYRADDCQVMESGLPKHLEELAELNGERRWFETFKSPVFNGSGLVIGTAGTAADITAHMNSEEQMRLLKSAVASVSESIIITDVAGVIVYVNPSFTRNTGFTLDEAIGKTPAILNSKRQAKSFYRHFWQTIMDGEPWSGRILDRRKDGTIFPVHLSVAPIFDDTGATTHFVAVHEDLTEAEKMQKQLMQSQKMESVGIMAGGIAHDFNNLLASLTGNMYLLRLHHQGDEEVVERTRNMETSMYRAAKMIQQLLTFARKDRPEMHDMDLRGFIKEVQKLVQASLPENIAFALDCPMTEPVWIHGDATQLQQVLLNLVVNARHAVSGKPDGRIILQLGHDHPDAQLMAEHAQASSDEGWCYLRCTDNGCGIEPAALEHIFDPFFTTREAGQGTGLGLAMVYGAVQNHSGIIDVQSSEGEGTVFTIYLPLRSAREVDFSDDNDVCIDGTGKGILLVDDEPGLRLVLAEVLQQNGFAVWVASDGEEAVDLFRKNSNSIDLVLMDVVMPNMGGVAAAEEIRAMHADLPIIFQTGYGEDTQLTAAQTISHSESLQKPVKIPELLLLIEESLR